MIENHLNTWRITTHSRLKAELCSLTDEHISQSLWRLRKRRKVVSLKVGNEWYHFDASMKRRAEALRELSADERDVSFSSWGMQHHLQVIDLGIRLKYQFPEHQITPNLFSEHHSFTQGSLGLGNKKYAPDLIVAPAFGTQECIYIEVERTMKSEARYLDRWLAFEGDPHVSLCLYWITDRRLAARLQDFAIKYFQGSRVELGFTLGFAVSDSSETLRSTPVYIYGSNFSERRMDLHEVLSPKNLKTGGRG